MSEVWICPDRRCHAVTITDDETVSITCTRRDPHLPDRVFPEKVKLDIAGLFQVAHAARECMKMSGYRACEHGGPPTTHVNPRAFSALVSALGEASALDEKQPPSAGTAS